MARTVTVTFEDGSTHVYQNVPDTVTPDDIESRAASEFDKPITNIDGGRFASSEGGAAVGVAGKRRAREGVDTLPEALTKVGGATALGAAMGAAAPEILQAAGRAASALPYPATKAAGTFVENMGTVLKGARGQSIVQGGVSGATSETAGQLAENMGADTLTAEGARLVGGALGPELLTGVVALARQLTKLPALSWRSKIVKYGGKELLDKITGAPENISEREQAYLRELIGELRGGAPSTEPMKAVYGGLEQGARNTRALAYDEAQRVLQSADEQAQATLRATMGGDVARLRTGQERLSEIGATALDAARANRLHMGNDRSLSEIGTDLRDVIVRRNESALGTRQAEFKANEEARNAIVASREGAGQPINALPEYASIVQALEAELKPGRHSVSVATGIKKILDDIRVPKQAETERAWNPVTGASQSITPETPISFQAIDDARRHLGDVFKGEAAEGYAAIGEANARKYYKMLSDLQKKYAGEPQEKLLQQYAESSDALQMFRSKAGKRAAATDRYDDSRFQTDASALPTQFFRSRQGVQDLVELTGDRTLVNRAAHEYAVRQLENKTEPQVRTWMTANRDWLDAVPEVRMSVMRYANALEKGERVAANAERGIARVAQREADTIREAEKFADQLRSAGQREAAGITGTAEQTAKTLLGNEAAVKRVRTLIESGRVDQWAAAGPAITQSAPAKQAVFDAVRQTLADKVKTPASANGLQQLYSESIQPFVEGARLVTPAQSSQILGKLAMIAEMRMPDEQKLGFARRILLQSIAGYSADLGARAAIYAIPD